MTIAADTLYVLAIGGSNTQGRGTGGPAMNGASTRVTVWNNDPDMGASDGSAFIASPTATNVPWDASGGNNFGLWFCDRAAKELSRDVKMVMVAKSSASITDVADGGDMREKLIDVLAVVSPGRPADVLMCFLGYADVDGGMPEATFVASFLAWRSDMIADGLIGADTPVLLSGAAASYVDDTFIETMCDENSGLYFARASDLGTTDGSHFTGPDLHHLGSQRMWSAYSRHIGPRQVSGGLSRLLGAFG